MEETHLACSRDASSAACSSTSMSAGALCAPSPASGGGVRHAGELRALPGMHMTCTDNLPGESARRGRLEAWRDT